MAPTPYPTYLNSNTTVGEAYQSVDAFTPFVWEYLCIGMWAYMLYRLADLGSASMYTSAWHVAAFKDSFAARVTYEVFSFLFYIWYLWAVVLFFTYEDQWKDQHRQWRHNAVGLSFLLWPVCNTMWQEYFYNRMGLSDVWYGGWNSVWWGLAFWSTAALGCGITILVATGNILGDSVAGRDGNNLGSIAALIFGAMVVLWWLAHAFVLPRQTGTAEWGWIPLTVMFRTRDGGGGSAKVRSGGKDGLGKYAQTNDDEAGTSRKKGSRRALESAETFGY